MRPHISLPALLPPQRRNLARRDRRARSCLRLRGGSGTILLCLLTCCGGSGGRRGRAIRRGLRHRHGGRRGRHRGRCRERILPLVQRVPITDATALLEILRHLFMPVIQIRRAEGLLRRAGEDEVRHLQIALRPIVWGRLGAHLLGHHEGGLAHLHRGAIVAADRRQDLVPVNHCGIVTDGRRMRQHAGVVLEQQADHNERVLLCDEAAARLERLDARIQLLHLRLQLRVLVLGESLLLVLGSRRVVAGLVLRQKRVRRRGLLRPLVAGERLVVVAVVNVRRHGGHAVSVRAIRHHIHLTLDEQRLAARRGVRQFQDRLAVEEIVLVQQLRQARQVLLHQRRLLLIQLVVEAGDLARLQHRAQARQHLRQLGIDPCQLRQRRVRLRHLHLELELHRVRALVLPLDARVGPLLRIQLGLDGDAVEERGHIHILAWHKRRRQRRRRRGHLHDALLDHRLGHLPHHHLRLASLLHQPRQRCLDLPRVRRERQHQPEEHDPQQQGPAQPAKEPHLVPLLPALRQL